MRSSKIIKTFFLVSFIIILVFSAFSLMPKSTLGDNTYDFQGISNPSSTHVAYEGSDPNQPPTGWKIGVEMGSSEYNKIATSNDERAMEGWEDSDYHRFNFTIYEPVNTITQIYVEHEGYGVDEDDIDGIGPPGLTLYIWNYMTTSWEALDSHDEDGTYPYTDGILSKTITENIENYVNTNGYLTLLVQTKENSGSCPFLFTNNREEYVFAADLYGNGIIDIPYYYPIPEDYAVIEGDLLQVDGSLYRMSIAQEYDEISYLDQTALITVDHSPSVRIAPSFLTKEAGKIYTISSNLASPLSATDGEGKDVLQLIAEKDGIYALSKQYQLNTLELDLGDLSDAKEIKLVVDAYTRWTPGSKTDPYKRFVQVKGVDGDWVNIFDISKIVSPAAFPRTYVLDLTGKFMTDDYSVRFIYSSEIRVDYVGVDTSPQQDVTVNVLHPESADLHFRGYSSLKGVPATPDYYDVSPEPPKGFSNPIGNFTRFGDVLPLLNDRDDKFVIMHHGDEISVDYPYVPAPEGMERDFIYYSCGYYKNKYYGTGGTVDPLPFRGMSVYPYPADESYPSDSEHNAYLKEYNTREYNLLGSVAEPSEHHSIFTDYVKVVVSARSPATRISYPVGGVVMPAKKLLVFAPYLVIVGLVAAITTTAIIVKRRRKV